MYEIAVGEFHAGIRAQSVWDPTRNRVRVESLEGEGVPAGLLVECSKIVREQHPLGTVFRLDVRVTSKSGHGLHLCSVRKFELSTEPEWLAAQHEVPHTIETAQAKLDEVLTSELHTQFELAEARKRLVDFSESAASEAKQRERLYPDELTPGELVPDGGLKQVRVNAYERNQSARRKCLSHHGARCMVCDLDFEARYGNIGRGFIHVHHTVPLASVPEGYRLDPLTDLVPVCPNCHAMLHRTAVVLSVAELKERLRLAAP